MLDSFRDTAAAPMQTAKQKIESDFHDRWARELDPASLSVRESFEAATAVENRWALERLSPIAGLDVVDLGCGAGEAAVYFARQGARVSACDLSPGMADVALRLARLHGAAVDVAVAAAESLPYPDAAFDRVFANGVLHHAELLPALREVRRVLKPGGRAAFIEPLRHNPLISIYRRLAAGNRTPTEAALGVGDFAAVRRIFPGMVHRVVWLFSL
ncbi:MAG: class I SAM-dependent methyltransferase, partial [Elusimicrobia bacterium]|nr:class I SAM-dependent methyltransferase [Elusimicrobiota bacterium]